MRDDLPQKLSSTLPGGGNLRGEEKGRRREDAEEEEEKEEEEEEEEERERIAPWLFVARREGRGNRNRPQPAFL